MPFRAVPRNSLVGSRAQPDKAVVERHRGVVRDDADRRVALQRQHRFARPTVVGQGPEAACTIADVAFRTPQAGRVAPDVVTFVVPGSASPVTRAVEDVRSGPDGAAATGVDGAAALGAVGAVDVVGPVARERPTR